jgi:4'-phosphopantetheinyl transferase
MIELWVDRMVDRYDPAMLESLSSVEVQRARRMRSGAARGRYIVAHHWLRVRLGTLFDIAPADVPLRVGSSGALALDGDARSVSFSHHKAHIALAVSADASIGVDVLELPDDTRFVGDTGLVLSSPEIALVRASTPPRRPAVFAHCWTRKEAYGKMRGSGLTADLPAITLTPRAPSQLDASLRSYEFADVVVAVATPGSYVGATLLRIASATRRDAPSTASDTAIDLNA